MRIKGCLPTNREVQTTPSCAALCDDNVKQGPTTTSGVRPVVVVQIKVDITVTVIEFPVPKSKSGKLFLEMYFVQEVCEAYVK